MLCKQITLISMCFYCTITSCGVLQWLGCSVKDQLAKILTGNHQSLYSSARASSADTVTGRAFLLLLQCNRCLADDRFAATCGIKKTIKVQTWRQFAFTLHASHISTSNLSQHCKERHSSLCNRIHCILYCLSHNDHILEFYYYCLYTNSWHLS